MRGPRRGAVTPVPPTPTVVAAVMSGRVANPGPIFGTATVASLFRGLRRFGRFCRRHQTRSVSSEITTPNLASDCTSNVSEAPALRSAINTSRNGSRAVNRWERGRRPAATSWANFRASPVRPSAADWSTPGATSGNALSSSGAASGAVAWHAGEMRDGSGVSESCSPADAGLSVVCMPVKYRARSGRARGAPRSESKPQGLDVGVPAYCFIWILACRHKDLDTIQTGSSSGSCGPSYIAFGLSQSRGGVAHSRRSLFNGRVRRGAENGGSRC